MNSYSFHYYFIYIRHFRMDALRSKFRDHFCQINYLLLASFVSKYLIFVRDPWRMSVYVNKVIFTRMISSKRLAESVPCWSVLTLSGLYSMHLSVQLTNFTSLFFYESTLAKIEHFCHHVIGKSTFIFD